MPDLRQPRPGEMRRRWTLPASVRSLTRVLDAGAHSGVGQGGDEGRAAPSASAANQGIEAAAQAAVPFSEIFNLAATVTSFPAVGCRTGSAHAGHCWA